MKEALLFAVGMFATAIVTVVGGVLWNDAWSEGNTFKGIFGFILLALAFIIIANGFHIPFIS